MTPTHTFESILGDLLQAGVDFILVGGLAVELCGFTRVAEENFFWFDIELHKICILFHIVRLGSRFDPIEHHESTRIRPLARTVGPAESRYRGGVNHFSMIVQSMQPCQESNLKGSPEGSLETT